MLVTALGAARADVGASLALLSDYRLRGVSLSDGQPSAQGRLDWQDDRGLFAGLQLSLVRTGENSELGVSPQGVAGYSHAFAGSWTWSAGLTGYAFPSSSGGPGNYTELFARAGNDSVQAGVFVSNDYFGSGARSLYTELSGTRQLNDSAVLGVHLGWLITSGAGGTYAAYDSVHRVDGRIGLIFDLRAVTAEVGLAGVLTQGSTCRSYEHCRPAPVAILRKAF
jgi:uncharacterized protein (TIGR02001 family)